MVITKPRLLFLYNDYRQDKDEEAGGCGWYRIVGPASAIKKKREDWDVTIAHNPPSEYNTWDKWLVNFDLIWVHHPDKPEFIATLMGVRDFNASKVVVDVDDNYLDVDPSNPAKIIYFEGSPIIEFAMRAIEWSDVTTVTTTNLKNVYQQYNKNIRVLPNSIDPLMWKQKEKGEDIVIGYAGSPTHYEDLMMIIDPLSEIIEQNENVSLKFMNYVPQEYLDRFRGRIKHVRGETSYKKYVSSVNELGFSIGIAPLIDNNFNKGKSACKYLEYSMMGIPTVASRIGPYRRIIRNNVNGFLCETAEEWKDALSLLIDDNNKRQQIGQNAKEFVLRDYSFDSTIDLWIDTIENLLNDKN